MNQPKGLTAASGIDALTHALEAYASIMATEYTDGLALQAMKNIFEYLPAAYELGAHDAVARERWQQLLLWLVWLLLMLSLECATHLHINWVHITTFHTELLMPFLSLM